MKLFTIAWFELRTLARTRAVLLNLFLLPMVLIFILGSALSGNFADGSEASIDPVRVMIVVATPQPGREAHEQTRVQSQAETGAQVQSQAEPEVQSEGETGVQVQSQTEIEEQVQVQAAQSQPEPQEQEQVQMAQSQREMAAGAHGVGLGLKEFLGSPEIEQRLQPEYVTSREGTVKALIQREADFAVVIPHDFEQRVMTGMEAKWELIPGKDGMKNHIAEMIFQAYLDEVNRIQAAIIALGPEGVVEAMKAMNDLDSTYVETATLNEQGKMYSSFQYYAASMLIMFLLYSGLSASISLSEERRNNTLYRLNAMPVSTLEIFTGKIVGNSLVAFLQAAVIIGGTSLLYGVDWGNHLGLLILICVLVVMASMMLAVVITLLVKSSAVARSVVVTVIVVMTFLSGGFQPLPIELVQRLGEFTVSHWALQGTLRLMLGVEPAEAMQYIMMLGLCCGLLLIAGIVSYRKVGYHE